MRVFCTEKTPVDVMMAAHLLYPCRVPERLVGQVRLCRLLELPSIGRAELPSLSLEQPECADVLEPRQFFQQPLTEVQPVGLLLQDAGALRHSRHELESERAGQVLLAFQCCRLLRRGLVGHGHKALEVRLHDEWGCAVGSESSET